MAFSEAVARRGLDPTWNRWRDFIWSFVNGDRTMDVLTHAVIAHESAWRADAVNPGDPSYGLMQILYSGPPAFKPGPAPSATIEDLLDPENNLRIGMTYLMHQMTRYGHRVQDALAAYNAGSVRRQTDGRYRNQDYVDVVMAYYAWYAVNLPAPDTSDPVISDDPGPVDVGPGTVESSTTAITGILGILALLAAITLKQARG